MAKWSAWANAIYLEFFCWPTIIFMCQAVVCNMAKIIQATSNDSVFLSIDRSWTAQPWSLPASEWPVAQRQHKGGRLPLGGRKSRFGLSGRWDNRVCQCHHRWPLSQKRAHLQQGIDSTGRCSSKNSLETLSSTSTKLHSTGWRPPVCGSPLQQGFRGYTCP